MMNLTELFYGTFTPPPVSNVRRHNFGLTGGARYEPPKKPLSQRFDLPLEDRLAGSFKKIYNVLKVQTKPLSSADMSKKVAWTRNHCSIIMQQLFTRGMVKRHKKAGTNIYLYYVQKDTNDE